MMSLDNQNLGGEFGSPRDSAASQQLLADPLYKQEMKYRQFGDAGYGQNDKHLGMHFEVIINRKREKILQIQGFRETDDMILLESGTAKEQDDEE